MPTPLVLQIENQIARAHRATYSAAYLAESLKEQALCDDLQQIAAELRRVQESLLRGPGAYRASKASRAYLREVVTDAESPAS